MQHFELFVRRKTNYFPIAICGALVAISIAGCRAPVHDHSRVKFTVANRNAKNVALVVGSPNNLAGVPKDVINVSNMIRQNDLGYEIQVINNATKSQILGYASELSAQLTPESTVFFYFSGHGAATGVLATQGYGSMTIREVANSFASRLSSRKFKRFIGVIDACYSGQSAIGNEAMFLNDNQQNFSLDGFLTGLTTKPTSGLFGDWTQPSSQTLGSVPKGFPPFEQGLVLAAARPTEESLDAGESVGGIFTYSWLQAIQSGKSSTLQEILENTKRITVMNSNGSHTPVWKVMPEAMLQERFDRRDNGSNGSVTNDATRDQINSPSNQTTVTVGGLPVGNQSNTTSGTGIVSPITNSSNPPSNGSNSSPSTTGDSPSNGEDMLSKFLQYLFDEE